MVAFAAIPIVAWVLGALGVTAVAGYFMGWLVPIITALLFLFFSMALLNKGVDAFATAKSQVFGALLILLAVGGFLVAVVLVNPSMFAGTFKFAVADDAPAVSAESVDWFAAMSISDSVLGHLSPTGQLVLLMVVLIGAPLAYERFGKGRR